MLKSSKKFLLTHLCIAALGATIIPQSHAHFPNVHTMLEALRPTAPVAAPQLNQVILAIDGLPPVQDKQNVLATLVPMANLSVLAASETANRRMIKRLNERVLELHEEGSGYNSGDDDDDFWEEIFEGDDDEAPQDAQAAPKEEVSIDEKYDFSFAKETKEEPAVEEDPYKGLWGSLFGSSARQRNRDGVFGYDSTTLGGFLGRDWLVGERVVLGLAIGYQQSDVDSNVISGSYMDIKRLNLSAYWHYTCPSSFYLMALVTGAQNRYDSHRNILVPPVGGSTGFAGKAHGSFKGWEAHAHFEVGKSWNWGGLFASPKLFTNYTHWSLENYQEHDALGLNLNVHQDNIDNFSLGAGLVLEYRNHFQRAIVIPYIHGFVMHDFVQDQHKTVNQFQGGGFAFQTNSFEPSGGTYEVAAGINVHSYKDIVFDLHYEYAGRSKYHRHNLALKLRYEWA